MVYKELKTCSQVVHAVEILILAVWKCHSSLELVRKFYITKISLSPSVSSLLSHTHLFPNIKQNKHWSYGYLKTHSYLDHLSILSMKKSIQI